MASHLPPDPYAVLGVAKDAKLPEIRSAHRKLVLKHQPDGVKDDDPFDAFQRIQHAYELLSDDDRRMQYDEQFKSFELREELARPLGEELQNPTSNPVELPIRASTSALVAPPRPRTRDERPRTTHTSSGQRRNTSYRPESSTRRPPSEHKRIGSSSTHRPRTSEQQSRIGSSSTTRPPKSEHGGKRSASQRDYRKSRQFPAIQEYPDDRNIRREVKLLGTFISQHVISFYTLNNSGHTGMPEMDSTKTRHPAIRRYIAQQVIKDLIIADGEGYEQISTNIDNPKPAPMPSSSPSSSSSSLSSSSDSSSASPPPPRRSKARPTSALYSIPSSENDTSWQEPTRKTQKDFVVEQRGIRVLIKHLKESAFGDTGAGQNVISDRRRQELGLEMRPNPTSFPMGNSKRIWSPGTVEVPLAFEDDPTNVMTIIAHVVHTFAYDLLLGNPFLQATRCLTKFKHRFVRCFFTIKSIWSFNLLGETTQRFKCRLGKDIPFLGLPDIGSARNVMDARWANERAREAGFKILSGPEYCGWVLFPNGTEEATIGQAHTTMTLPDGKVVPIVFEILPNCHFPVVLGQDFIFDHDIYNKYASSILEFDDNDSGDELMPMGFRWNKKSKAGTAAGPTGQKLKDDLEKQLDWNIKYQDGRTASVEEWNLEHARREQYERSLNADWQPDPRIPLIEHKPKALGEHSTRPPTLGTAADGSSGTSRSFQSGGSTLESSSDSPHTTQDDLSVGWDADPYFSDSLVSDETAQWQAERPT